MSTMDRLEDSIILAFFMTIFFGLKLFARTAEISSKLLYAVEIVLL